MTAVFVVYKERMQIQVMFIDAGSWPETGVTSWWRSLLLVTTAVLASLLFHWVSLLYPLRRWYHRHRDLWILRCYFRLMHRAIMFYYLHSLPSRAGVRAPPCGSNTYCRVLFVPTLLFHHPCFLHFVLPAQNVRESQTKWQSVFSIQGLDTVVMTTQGTTMINAVLFESLNCIFRHITFIFHVEYLWFMGLRGVFSIKDCVRNRYRFTPLTSKHKLSGVDVCKSEKTMVSEASITLVESGRLAIIHSLLVVFISSCTSVPEPLLTC